MSKTIRTRTAPDATRDTGNNSKVFITEGRGSMKMMEYSQMHNG